MNIKARLASYYSPFVLSIAVCIVCISPSTEIQAASNTLTVNANASGGEQWPTFNNRLDGQRFSPLSAITPQNASELGELCRLQIDGPTSFMAGLIVVDGILYTSTARTTVAMDATSCAVKWMHTYTPEDAEITPSSRGPAVMNGRVFRGTGDGRLLALDAETGEVLWKNVIGSSVLGEFASAAPLAWQGIVYMGIAGSELGIRGRIMAFDAETGRELWRFNTIPQGDDVGAETWERAESARTGGGGVWGAMSVDVTTAELFIPVGNPWPDLDPNSRPGDNLFTNSIVVLDANTGKLKWWYQATANDAHDQDLAAAPVLYRDSQIRDIMAFGGKDGHVVALDRQTHEPVFRTAVTKIENATALPTDDGVNVCPGFAGGIQWNGPTLDRNNNTLVSGVVDLCMELVKGPVKYDPPNGIYGGSPRVTDEPRGAVIAIDTASGEIKWRYSAEKPVIAGVTPTAGGVTFTGDLAGNLLVLNSETGVLEHKIETGGAMAGGVVTYEINGTQYVAAASGNVSRNAFGVLGVPTVVIMKLNPDSPASPSQPIATFSTSGTNSGEINLVSGQATYARICTACHGPDGDTINDFKLSTLAARLDFDETVAYIKQPRLPMPTLYPALLSQQDIENVSAYLHQNFSQ